MVRGGGGGRGGWWYAPHNFAKLKRYWCVYLDFQHIILMYRMDLNDAYASFTAHTDRISYVNTTMNFFNYNLRPTLIFAAILGKVLQLAMGVEICVHNRHLYTFCSHSYMSRLSKHGICLLKCRRITHDGCL